jgi:hypothetical protein
MAKLQKGRKYEELRQRMNSPKLGRRQWNGGERTEEDPISQQCYREKRRRRRRRRRCRAASSVGAGVEQVDGGASFLFLGPAVKRKGQRGKRRGRRCGVKRRSLPPPPYLYITG